MAGGRSGPAAMPLAAVAGGARLGPLVLCVLLLARTAQGWMTVDGGENVTMHGSVNVGVRARPPLALREPTRERQRRHASLPNSRHAARYAATELV